MAPKCLLEGHDGKDILYVCIRRDCNLPTRLVCETCFFKSHQQHNCEFLAIDEIKRGEVEKLRYWPFEPEFRPIYEFVNKQDSYVTNMIQDVNATFHVHLLSLRVWHFALFPASTRYALPCSNASTISTSKRVESANFVRRSRDSYSAVSSWRR